VPDQQDCGPNAVSVGQNACRCLPGFSGTPPKCFKTPNIQDGGGITVAPLPRQQLIAPQLQLPQGKCEPGTEGNFPFCFPIPK
jgi:hypothetical protein